MTMSGFPSPRRLRYRIAQGLGALWADVPSDAADVLGATLTPPQIHAFDRLSTHDRAHLLRVLGVIALGTPAPSPDLSVAAVLHDIGKAGPNGRVRLVDRVMRVVLGRLAPSLWRRLSHAPASGWRAGMVMAEHHPILGSRIAAELGCSDRVCWLIQHHADRHPPEDDELRLLIAADHSAR